jgi:YfiH family protein
MKIWKKVNKNGLTFLSFEGWEGVSCCISTRIGGVSPSPYASLNLGLSSGDNQENVLKNRTKLYEALGVDSSSVIIPGQVHGNEIRIVNSELRIMNSEFADQRIDSTSQTVVKEEGSDLSSGLDPATRLPSIESPFTNHQSPICDGLLTQEPGLVLGITVADCLAIFIFDSRKKAIGILHAGWRGIEKGITREAIRKMNENFGTDPENCEILLSPSIGSCCYEVKEDVYEPITRSLGGTNALEKRNGKVFLDLCKAAIVQMEKEGVKNIHLQQNDLNCTSCHVEDYFSYRKETGKTGRMLAIIWLK